MLKFWCFILSIAKLVTNIKMLHLIHNTRLLIAIKFFVTDQSFTWDTLLKLWSCRFKSMQVAHIKSVNI